jgi:superfamily II DNA or RNA helicase
LRELSPEEGTLLTALALSGAAKISTIADLARAVGLRETSARQHSTTTLRPVLSSLQARGLVYEDGGRFACRPALRAGILRHSAKQQRLRPLASGALELLFPARRWDDGRLRRIFELRVALAEARPNLCAEFDEVAALVTPFTLLREVLVPALVDPFDAAWFERLPEDFVERWVDAALGQCEALGDDVGELIALLVARWDRLARVPLRAVCLAGMAIERGDLLALEKLSALQLDDASAAIAAARCAIAGDYAEAARLVPQPRKGTPQGTGLVGILNALVLVTHGKPADLELVKRLISAGSRKGAPFRSSYRLLKLLAERASAPAGAGDARGLLDDEEPDAFLVILRMLYACWFQTSPSLSEYLVGRGESLAKILSQQRLDWLASETLSTARALQACKASETRQGALDLGESAAQPARPGSQPLWRMRAAKAPWELALEGLERLAAKTSSTSPESAVSDERLIWRVLPEVGLVEPYLQKRVGSGWSRGRKLAIKHLLHGSAQRATLPPEDARVADYAREEREIYGGYPQTRHFLLPDAFMALVGHPRVFVDEEDAPVEVLRGQVQLVVRSAGPMLTIVVDPPEFRGALQVRREARRLFVYALEAEAEPLLAWLGPGLSLPAAAQERALGVLGQLSHLLPVQSFESSNARKVDADARPWLRIAPRGNGLSVAVSARPLGPHGPHVKPGQGAPTLLARVDGAAVQADRDLDAERRLSEEALAHCDVLAGAETGELAYELADPLACLELISKLRDLEASVHVEWPHGTPLRLRARVSRKALRGGVTRASDFFLATGEVAVDEELSLGLRELLELLVASPGRFIRLQGGDYVELEQELLDTLEAMAAAQVPDGPRGSAKRTGAGVALSKSALSALEPLLAEGSGFELDKAAGEFRDRLGAAFSRKFRVPRALEAELRAYQQDGFFWLARLSELELGACLADDMGLGKTVQILALLLHRVKTGPALVVAPTSVCDNWRDEITRFAPSLEVRWYSGLGREPELEGLGPGKVVITSYALLQQDAEKLQAIPFGTAVLDEAQFIKNSDSLRAKAACGLDARMRVAATGTPVENHVGDLFGIFQFLMPELLGSRASFGKRFPLAEEGDAGAAARRNLRRLMQPFVLRRTKAQVLTELPQLTEIRRTVALSPAEAALYETLRRAAIEKLSAAPNARDKDAPRDHFQVLAEITRLRRLCCHPELVAKGTSLASSKLASFLELVDELIEGRHRALVFSQFVDMLSLVRSALDERKIAYQYLDGATPQAQRKAAVEAFQAGEGDLFLISLRAGGFGLNLTAADYVIHLDPWWNPAVEAQASDRAHRIGQTRPVTVYRLVTAQTIEERILELHRTKRELADSLLEESDRAAKLTAKELRALLDG